MTIFLHQQKTRCRHWRKLRKEGDVNGIAERIAREAADSGMSIRKLAEAAGIPYMNLYNSLSNRNRRRELRASELIAVCKVLEMDLEAFAETKN